MKKMLALILVALCLFMLSGCGNKADNDDKTEVYTFYGENDYVTVTNGTAVVGGEEETFSGGRLEVIKEKAFADAMYWSAEFYIAKDGEKKTLYKSVVEDLSDSAKVSISGDLGKISGGNVISDYESSDMDAFVNNLFMLFTVRNAEGEEKTYEIQMNVEKVC
jgi:uncharacterized lipoprotein